MRYVKIGLIGLLGALFFAAWMGDADERRADRRPSGPSCHERMGAAMKGDYLPGDDFDQVMGDCDLPATGRYD